MKNRVFRGLIIFLAALAFSATLAWVQVSRDAAKHGGPQTTKPVAGLGLSGPFRLYDQNGHIFTQKNLRGHLTLLYFGFTSCPAVCPTELQKINVATQKLGPAGEKVQQVFITIDPDRDTQKVMAGYVSQFNKHLIGLTGTQSEIDRARKIYKVYARKVKDPSLSGYTMDHSSYIYLIGRGGDVLALFGTGSSADDLAKAVRKEITP